MTETSKVSFLKKILKDQGSSHLSDIPLNNQQFFDNEGNHRYQSSSHLILFIENQKIKWMSSEDHRIRFHYPMPINTIDRFSMNF